MTKRVLFLLLLTSLAKVTWSQTTEEINNKNYYSRYLQKGSTNWLRYSDAVPIIIDELLKKGVPYHTISVGDLIKINDSTSLVVTITFEKAGKKYGFVYEATHGIPLNVKDRDFLTEKTQSFIQAQFDTKDDAKYMSVNPLPPNIFLIKETCYWFQFDNAGKSFPVTKTVASNILRQDVDDYVKRM